MHRWNFQYPCSSTTYSRQTKRPQGKTDVGCEPTLVPCGRSSLAGSYSLNTSHRLAAIPTVPLPPHPSSKMLLEHRLNAGAGDGLLENTHTLRAAMLKCRAVRCDTGRLRHRRQVGPHLVVLVLRLENIAMR